MPELPEVETVRRQLEDVVVGRTITRLTIHDPLLVTPASPAAVRAAVVGRRVTALGRRGKYLQLALDSGDTVVAHLRMTGRLHHSGGRPVPPDRHRRARIGLDDGTTVDFSDTRRFGRLWVLGPDHPDIRDDWSAKLGVEPLTPQFTPEVLGDALRGRATTIKAALLDQRRVAGIGNIYADESLFQAGIHPHRPAGSLDADEIRALRDAIVDRLQVGIAQGGASIDRYRDTLGRRGTMQDMLRAHLHEGDPCPVCGTTIVKTRVAQRGTYHCPSCQPAS